MRTLLILMAFYLHSNITLPLEACQNTSTAIPRKHLMVSAFDSFCSTGHPVPPSSVFPLHRKSFDGYKGKKIVLSDPGKERGTFAEKREALRKLTTQGKALIAPDMSRANQDPYQEKYTKSVQIRRETINLYTHFGNYLLCPTEPMHIFLRSSLRQFKRNLPVYQLQDDSSNARNLINDMLGFLHMHNIYMKEKDCLPSRQTNKILCEYIDDEVDSPTFTQCLMYTENQNDSYEKNLSEMALSLKKATASLQEKYYQFIIPNPTDKPIL